MSRCTPQSFLWRIDSISIRSALRIERHDKAGDPEVETKRGGGTSQVCPCCPINSSGGFRRRPRLSPLTLVIEETYSNRN